MPKVNICIVLMLFLSTALSAQDTAQDLNYLAVARGSAGEILINQQFSLRLQLYENDLKGELLYAETHVVESSAAGVFSIVIGDGKDTTGNFASISWDQEILWMEIRLDEDLDANFSLVNSSQIFSLPPHLRPIRDDTPFDRVNCQSGMAFWGISGNSNLKNECHYLGTKNEVDVIFKTNSTERLRIKASGKTVFTDSVLINAQLATRSLNMSTGARQNYLMVSDDQGNARWVPGEMVVDADTTNELQSLRRVGAYIQLSKGGGSIEDRTADADANPTNELQVLSRDGNRVYLSKEGGSFEDQTTDADADPGNELQVVTKNGNTVSLSGNGGTFSIADADANPVNELQQLSLNTESKELSLSQGNSVNLGSMLSNYWDRSGDNLTSSVSGNIGIGTPTPSQKLEVNGGVALGNTSRGSAGAIRWNGADFQGHDGSAWKSLTAAAPEGTTGLWTANGAKIHYLGGAVGVGNDEPQAQLDVAGSQRISDHLGIGIIPTMPLVIGSPEVPDETPTVVDQLNHETAGVFSPFRNNTIGWQSFTVAESGTLIKIVFKGSACGGYAPDINKCTGIGTTVDFYEGEGVEGRLLKGGMVKQFNTGPGTGELAVAFPTNSPIQVEAGKQYTIKFNFNDENYVPSFHFSNDNAYPGGRAFFQVKEQDHTDMDLYFDLYLRINRPGKEGRFDFVVNKDGQVGIGTGQPNATLDVNGSIAADDLGVNSLSMKNGAEAGFLLVSDETGRASWQSPSSLDFRREGDWQIGSKSVYLPEDERVGIGTSQPRYSVDINQEVGNDPPTMRLSALGTGSILFEQKNGSQAANHPRAQIAFDGNRLQIGKVGEAGLRIDQASNLLLDGSIYATGSARFVPPGSEREPGDGFVRIIAPEREGQTQALYVGVKETANFLSVSMDGQTWVNGIPSSTAYDDIKAYPLMVSGGKHGIGVQVDTNEDIYGADHNFMSFFRGSIVAGRIEGFNGDKDWFPPEIDITDAQSVAEFICYLQEMLGGVPPPDGPSLALLPASIALNVGCRHGGVTYASGNGDYAEYLEKEDPMENFTFGDIVGVRGGKISKNTVGAEQVMCISLAPIVLGNQAPHDSLLYRYEKVAFMGQVPVKVEGVVNTGDYILASARNDGFGIAVAPENLSVELLPRIVGRAYSSSEYKGRTFVNMVVGVKTNEWVEIFRQQQLRLNKLEEQVSQLTSLERENAQLRADLDSVLDALGLPSQVNSSQDDR